MPGGKCFRIIAPGGRPMGGRFVNFCISWDCGINNGVLTMVVTFPAVVSLLAMAMNYSSSLSLTKGSLN